MTGESRVVRLVANRPRLLWSNDSLLIEGTAYPSTPLFLDGKQQIIWAATDWALKRVTKGGYSRGTITRESYALRQWYEYLERERLDWLSVSDAVVRQWRQFSMAQLLNEYDAECGRLKHIEHPKIREAKRRRLGSRDVATVRFKIAINFKLDTLTAFYLWAQRNGYTDGRIIGVADLARNIPKPPLTLDARARIDPGTGEVTSETCRSPWRYKAKIQTKIDIPSGDEMEAIKDALCEMAEETASSFDPLLTEALLVRNSLIIDLLHIGQLRIGEIPKLSISDIPDDHSVKEHLEKNRSFPLDVIGKGEKWRKVHIPPYLIEQLRSYIDASREELVAILRSRINGYRDNGCLFPSSRTGKAIGRRRIQSIIESLRERTGIYIRGHQFRHRGITEYLMWRRQEQVTAGRKPDDGELLVEAKDRLGHAEKTDTARIYLHTAKLEEESRNRGNRPLDTEKDQLNRKIKILETRLRMRDKPNSAGARRNRRSPS